MTQDLVDRIWSAIQRPSPAVTRDEIAEMVKMHVAEAPEFTEDSDIGKLWVPEEIDENNSDLMRLRGKKPSDTCAQYIGPEDGRAEAQRQKEAWERWEYLSLRNTIRNVYIA